MTTREATIRSMTRRERRFALLRLALALGALLAAPALARAQGPAAAPVASWQDIARMLAGVPVAAPAAREIEPDILLPEERTRALEFRGAIPNPFHSETAIRFALPTSAHVSLRVYDVAGKLVRTLVDAQLPAGDHSAMLVAGEMRSGVYYAVLRVGLVTTSRSVVLTR